MFIIFILFLWIIDVVYIFIYHGDKKSPLFLYLTIWTVILSLYQMHLFTIYDVSKSTERIICLSVLSFILGGVISNSINKSSWMFNSYGVASICGKRLRIIVIILFVSSLSYYYQLLQSLIQNGWQSQINKLLLATGEIDTGGPLIQFFVRPFEFIIIPISTYYFHRKYNDKIVAFSGLYFSILKFLCTGSKSILFYYILCFVIAYLHFNKSKKYIGFKFILYLIIGIIVFFVSTGLMIRSLYFYICGCVPMLDKVLNNHFYFDGNYTYGFLSFNSLIRLFINSIKLIGIDLSNIELYRSANNAIMRFEYTTQISDYGNYNAFTTYISNFYIDGGIFGVAFFSIIFGYVTVNIYQKFKKTKSLYCFIQLMLVYYFIIFSGVRFQLSNTIIGCAFIYSILLGKKITGESLKKG